jgi:chorismate mutase
MTTGHLEGGGREPAPTGGAEGGGELERLRAEIERVDRQVIALIAERIAIARDVGRAKRASGLPTLDPAREALLIRRAAGMAREAGVEPEGVRAIFWHLIAMSRKAQVEEG